MYLCNMVAKDTENIDLVSFNDIAVIGINSSLMDYKLAWSLNDALSLDFTRRNDFVSSGNVYPLYHCHLFENSPYYDLLSLNNGSETLLRFKPRLDYLFLIQNSLTAERRLNLIQSIRAAEGVVHAFLLEKDKVMRQVLETIGDCEQKMIDKKKKLNNLNEVRKQMREQEALQAQLRENS